VLLLYNFPLAGGKTASVIQSGSSAADSDSDAISSRCRKPR